MPCAFVDDDRMIKIKAVARKHRNAFFIVTPFGLIDYD